MSLELRFHPKAFAEAECIIGDYEAYDHRKAVKFRRLLEEKLGKAVEDPHIWNVRSEGYHRINLDQFPFYIAYIVEGDHLVVLTVANAWRLPEFWVDRLP